MHHIDKAEIKDLLVSSTVREGIVILQGKFNIILPVCIQYMYIVGKYETYLGGRHGLDRMVVGFTTTCAISAFHH